MIVGNDGGRAPGATARTIAWAAVIAMSLVAAMPLGTASAAERTIEGIAGRYVVLLSDGVRPRVYMDPVCDMALVYDPVARVAASSLP